MISTYFGSMTMVLKLPFTNAASTKGLQRYNGLLEGAVEVTGDCGMELGFSTGGNVAEVGVGERLAGPRGALVIERLYNAFLCKYALVCNE